jgi:uracil-DNA glycosylase family 4
VLLLGEAPGASEDVVGQPFIGPAGKLIDLMLSKTRFETGNFKAAFSNVIGCIPIGEDGEKVEEPPQEAKEACQPRLEDFINLCDPLLLVTLGNVARKWIDEYFALENLPHISIPHPAYLLRLDVTQRDLQIQLATTTLIDAVETHVTHGEEHVPF